MIPMPGYAIVEIEKTESKSGLIVIPDIAQRKTAYGRVKAVEYGHLLKCNDCRHTQTHGRRCMKCNGTLRFRSGKRQIPRDDDRVDNRRVCVEISTGLAPIDEKAGLFRVPVDCIIAIIPEGLKTTNITGEVRRCRNCGPAIAGGTNGIMLIKDHSGWYCPRCRQYENGQIKKKYESLLK